MYIYSLALSVKQNRGVYWYGGLYWIERAYLKRTFCFKYFQQSCAVEAFFITLLKALRNLLARGSLKESVGYQLTKVTVIRLSIFDHRHHFSPNWRIMLRYAC